MDNKKLKENFDYVNESLSELLNLYRNKFILVVDKKVIGSYDTYESAAEAGVKTFGINGDFLVYEIFENEPVNFIMSAEL